MRALTLHGCHAWSVAHAGKNVENRSWELPLKHVGTRIAIHAGSNPGSAHIRARLAREKNAPEPDAFPRSAIVATVRLEACIARSGIVSGRLSREALERLLESRWFSGPFGWILTDVRALEAPIPCKGALGLWNLPDPIARILV